MRTVPTVKAISALAIGIGLFGFAGIAQAAVFVPTIVTLQQTSDECTGTCGINSGNTVKITNSVTTGLFDIQIQLASNWQFMGNFGPQTITFGLPTSITSLTFGAVTLTNNPPVTTATNNQFWSTAWAPAGFPSASNGATSYTQNALSVGPPGVPPISNAFQLNWNNGSGQSKADGNFVDFTISNSLLTLAMLQNTTYYVDVFSAQTGNTGIINFSLTGVPLPPAALLFGTALIGMGILGRRRRKEA